MSPTIIDEMLIKELRSPGSDQRCGVNMIARPTAALREQIIALQRSLKEKEPKQYYYPTANLHLTYIEICSGLKSADATEIFDRVINHFPDVLNGIPPVTLGTPRLQFDEYGGSLVFDNIGALNSNRNEIADRLIAEGVDVTPRYSTGSAHLTFLRYISPTTTDLKQLAEKQKIAGDWKLDQLTLTCGANWYGMKSRLVEIGPFSI